MDIREKELECAEEYIERISGSYLPGAFSIRPRCKISLPCMREVLDE
jgi:hypothetical protein